MVETVLCCHVSGFDGTSAEMESNIKKTTSLFCLRCAFEQWPESQCVT